MENPLLFPAFTGKTGNKFQGTLNYAAGSLQACGNGVAFNAKLRNLRRFLKPRTVDP